MPMSALPPLSRGREVRNHTILCHRIFRSKRGVDQPYKEDEPEYGTEDYADDLTSRWAVEIVVSGGDGDDAVGGEEGGFLLAGREVHFGREIEDGFGVG